MKIQIFIIFWIASCTCLAAQKYEVYSSDLLKIEQLSPNTYRHISYLSLSDSSLFPCNGMVYINGPEAIVMDCPTNNAASLELLTWLEDFDVLIRGVIINHFHVDCLGGLQVFHEAGLRSFAHEKTIEIAQANGDEVPKFGFKNYLSIPIGREHVYTKFFGEAHTIDNVVSYIPGDKVLFGGCMVKTVDAGYGNLDDSNQNAWPKTIIAIKEAYPEIEIVIPGHGKPGGMELLDYTISLFSGKVVK